MNRRNLLLLAPALFIPELAFAQTLNPSAKAAAITAVGQAVNAITRLQGRFIQTNPDMTSVAGRYWLQRPGRVRFEYDAPSPLLLVSDGNLVSLQDRRLKTTDRYPLRQTPLYFLLKSNVDLARDVNVTAVERNGGNLILTMQDKRREANGELTVIFDETTKLLEQWAIRDRQGRTTRIRLVDSAVGTAISPSLFQGPGRPLPQKRSN